MSLPFQNFMVTSCGWFLVPQLSFLLTVLSSGHAGKVVEVICQVRASGGTDSLLWALGTKLMAEEGGGRHVIFTFEKFLLW